MKWTPDATYSARSAYNMFFQGSERFEGAKPIWKAWAPLKVKFFMWLAIRRRIWTADRRHRHGLTGSTTCRLCHQEDETAEHLLGGCTFTKQIWHSLLTTIGIQNPPSITDQDFMSWWILLRQQGLSMQQMKGLDTAVMLVSWVLWKERNARVFSNTELTVNLLLQEIYSEWIGISRFQEFVHNGLWGYPASHRSTLTRQVKAAEKYLCLSSALAGIRLLEYHIIIGLSKRRA